MATDRWMTWVDIPEANADFPAAGCPDGIGFTGKMSRYPTTNAQYARYLAEALDAGDIDVVRYRSRTFHVVGTTGEFKGQSLFFLDGPGYPVQGAVDGGRSRISHRRGVFTVEPGFEDHPVTYVTWYGARAFAGHYGWRLPTEWEWESVANYRDHRTYPTGRSLHGRGRFLANDRSNGDHGYPPSHLPYHSHVEHGTTPVGYFGMFGYGLADLAGNVREWTATARGRFRVVRGGGWGDLAAWCTVAYRRTVSAGSWHHARGFRVCR